jgi:hypothetical protein
MIILSEKDKLDVLKHLHLVICDEIAHMRERQDKIFTWTSSILLLIIGASLVLDQSKVPVWANQGILGGAFASATIVLIVVFSTSWQQKYRHNQDHADFTQQKIEKQLGCFEIGGYGLEPGKMLYPDDWENKSGEPHDTKMKRAFQPNYVTATILLGVLAIALIWSVYI